MAGGGRLGLRPGISAALAVGSSGKAALAVIVAGGLVAGGLATMATVANKTLVGSDASAVVAERSLGALPGTLVVPAPIGSTPTQGPTLNPPPDRHLVPTSGTTAAPAVGPGDPAGPTAPATPDVPTDPATPTPTPDPTPTPTPTPTKGGDTGGNGRPSDDKPGKGPKAHSDNGLHLGQHKDHGKGNSQGKGPKAHSDNGLHLGQHKVHGKGKSQGKG